MFRSADRSLKNRYKYDFKILGNKINRCLKKMCSNMKKITKGEKGALKN